MLQSIVFRSLSKSFAKVHVRPCQLRTENTTTRFCTLTEMSHRSTLNMQRVADQANYPLWDDLCKRQKTGFRVNFFIRDVVLQIDVLFGEIALKNNHYYYCLFCFILTPRQYFCAYSLDLKLHFFGRSNLIGG